MAHLPFYPVRNFALVDELRVAAVPIREFHWTDDDWALAAPCRDYIACLQAEGADAAMTEYPGALPHAFEE